MTILNIRKPKNARSKRAMAKRDPLVVENCKKALFVRGSTTSQVVNEALKDLYSLKLPDAINFSKKNEIHPFDDETSVEFFSLKNDASLMVVGTHSKKRPHNLVFIRCFNHAIMDMVEVGIENAKSIKEFKTPKCGLGMRPCFLFNGEVFEQIEEYIKFKNLLIDFYNGEVVDKVNLAGLEHVITVTAGPSTSPTTPGKIYFRVYTIQLKKSGTRLPRVELEEMGPSYDMTLRRTRFATADIVKQATLVPRELKPKKVKNIKTDEFGDQLGRIHMVKQDFGKLQTRKMKGLKDSVPIPTVQADEDSSDSDEDSE